MCKNLLRSEKIYFFSRPGAPQGKPGRRGLPFSFENIGDNMKRRRLIPVFTLFLLTPAIASADALCNYDDTVKMDSYLKKGKEAEKSGKTRDALLYYLAVDSFCGDGVGAKSALKRIGLKLGAKAAEKGRLVSQEGLFRKMPDENCRRWMRHIHIDTNPYEPPVPGHCAAENGGVRVELNGQAGAYDWYEATFNYREADLALLKFLAKWPGDLEVFKSVFRHFELRQKLNSTGYSPDRSFIAEVEKTAAANLDSALSREDKEYPSLRQSARSIKALETALKWAAYLGEAAKSRVVARAIARGDSAFETGTPQGLADASAFFSLAEKEELKTAVLIRANELGRAALEKKDYVLAEEYFLVEGNKEMMDFSRTLAKKAAQESAAIEKP